MINDKQIEVKLQEIEDRNPQLFRQFKLKDHIFWSPVEGTNTLKWGIHPQFLGNLPFTVKVELGKVMNKLTKGGYAVAKTEEKEVQPNS